MANLVVAAAAAAAGAFATKILSKPHVGIYHDAASSTYVLDDSANKDHTEDVKHVLHLAQQYPEIDERDQKTPDEVHTRFDVRFSGCSISNARARADSPRFARVFFLLLRFSCVSHARACMHLSPHVFIPNLSSSSSSTSSGSVATRI